MGPVVPELAGLLACNMKTKPSQTVVYCGMQNLRPSLAQHRRLFSALLLISLVHNKLEAPTAGTLCKTCLLAAHLKV
jgi:hypothetical protein